MSVTYCVMFLLLEKHVKVHVCALLYVFLNVFGHVFVFVQQCNLYVTYRGGYGLREMGQTRGVMWERMSTGKG